MKKSLIIDMDDVIAECFMIPALNDFLGTNYTIDDPVFLEVGFFLQDVIKDPAQKQKFFDMLFKRYIYDNIPPKPDALEVLKKLNDKYDLYVCSSYLTPNQEYRCDKLISDKYKWLMKELPFLHPRQYMFMGAKQFLNVDVILDDRLLNLSPHAKTKLLFTAWHNKNVSDAELKKRGIVRVNNWQEVGKILKV
jgi:5'(3')-deoxyribonucleotidase